MVGKFQVPQEKGAILGKNVLEIELGLPNVQLTADFDIYLLNTFHFRRCHFNETNGQLIRQRTNKDKMFLENMCLPNQPKMG